MNICVFQEQSYLCVQCAQICWGRVVAGQEEDETSLLVKDLDGNIIKGVPVGISFLQKQNSRDYI